MFMSYVGKDSSVWYQAIFKQQKYIDFLHEFCRLFLHAIL
jgi:hypothetical protein